MTQKVIMLAVGTISAIILLVTALRSGITAVTVASCVISLTTLSFGLTLSATESDLREVFMVLNNGVDYKFAAEDEEEQGDIEAIVEVSDTGIEEQSDQDASHALEGV